ncbi:MAG: bifunctional oligoribonuclease/PAP phosphatase NrnA [Bacteroidales bacterium]|nr:bifunctional oligoribonuclease/PAP phosphatase NrnA [Bacteroidales bacterium]
MPELTKYTKELNSLVGQAKNIVLICHINPDGDAIGSQLAFYYYLKSIGREAEMISPNYLQEFLKWMDGSERITIFIREREKSIRMIREADLIILLDFNQPGRLGEAMDHVVESKARKVIIDHHLNPADFADLLISDPSKCSTAELVHELIKEINGTDIISKAYAEALYVGIITDTGNFEHGNFTGNTYRTVADLIDAGIDKVKIYNKIYNNFSVDRMRLQGLALNGRMVILPELKSAYIYLSKKDLKDYNNVKGDTEGFVNMPLSIKDIVFSTLFIEKDGFVKLSFRSKGTFPVNEFAARWFSGGGHLNASGGEFSGTLDEAIAHFLRVLEENRLMLNEAGPQ